MTLGESLHLSALPLIIFKVGMNVAPASRVVGRTRNHVGKVLAQYLAHRKSSVVVAIWILLRSFQSLIEGRNS